MLNWLQQIDQKIFLWINSAHSPFFDNIMWLISGQIIWIPFFLLIIYLFVKKHKKKAFLSLLFLLLSIAISDSTSVHLFKEVFKRLRPCHNPQIAGIVHIVRNHCGGKYGFVSSHATNFFALSTFSSLIIKKPWFTFCSFLIAIIVAYSRIYLGVHYPGDVLGGAILGFIISIVIFKIYLLILNQNNLIKKTTND